VRDLLEIPQEQLLQEQVQTLVLLEPQGSDEILEVPIEHLLQEVGQDNTLLEPVQELVLLTEAQQGPPGLPVFRPRRRPGAAAQGWHGHQRAAGGL
jgi:hypothetical protein